MIIAGIGSRDLTKQETSVCELIGRRMAELGHTLITGNARGADQAFARGVNEVDPTKAILVLPWRTYEEHAIVEGNEVIVFDGREHEHWLHKAALLHPAWHKLGGGGVLLMARNIGIIEPAEAVFAFPKLNRFQQLGGTGQGIRYAEERGITVVRLDELYGG